MGIPNQNQSNEQDPYRQLIENIKEVFWIMSCDGDQIIYVSPAYERIWGRPCTSFYNNPSSKFEAIHPDDRVHVKEALFYNAIKGEYDEEYRIVRPDGEVRWIRDRAFPIQDQHGEVCRIAGISQDISTRKKVRLGLRKEIEQRKRAESRVQKILNSSPSAIIVFSRKRKVILANSAAEKILGYTQKEMIGMGIEQFVPERFRKKAEHVKTSLRPFRKGRDIYALRKDGVEFPVSVMVNPISLDEGTFGLCTINDISERKFMEESLRESEERFRSAFENAAIGIALVTPDGRFIGSNQSLCSIFGYTKEELLATNFQAITYSEDLDADIDFARRMMSGEITCYRVEKRFVHKNGNVGWIFLNSSVVYNKAGKPLYFVSQVQDITEKKKMEKQLQQRNEELERSNKDLEQFAYVTSHDLKEPIRKIVGFTELFSNKYKGELDGEADEYIHYIVDGAKRMQRLIQDLLKFSRAGRQRLQLEHTDLTDLLHSAIENLESIVKENTAVISFRKLPVLKVAPVHFIQVFQNLLSNAIKYRSEAAPCIDVSAVREDGKWILSFKDNGIGIDPQYFERIFEVFQRLHGNNEYRGTGIGLAICKKIIERHGGEIWVESKLGKGTTFKFSLPEANQEEKSE